MKAGDSIFIAAGGTGGHTYPALAISEEFQKEGINIYWIGSLHGMEKKIVGDKNIKFLGIPVSGYRSKSKLKTIYSILLAIVSTFFSLFLIFKIRPKLVLGMGGYVSGPIGLAAILARTKLAIHEQNAVPGLTNKILCKFANRVFEGFPDTFESTEAIYSGSPVRKQIWLANKNTEKKPERLNRILILGGSTGARFLNNFMPRVIQKLCSEDKIKVLHQTGKNDLSVTKDLYKTLNLEDCVTVVPYIEAMDEAYKNHDLMLSRAGASTISEILAVGINSILIPFPYAVDAHQEFNARFLADKGACHLVLEKDCQLDSFVELVKRVGFSERVRQRIISTTSLMAKPGSASLIVKSCMELFNA